jgi:acetolactate synthase-1/2/3 large subunit
MMQGYSEISEDNIATDYPLTGAEAVALVLRQEGIRLVFSYPGTSELALCDAIERTMDISLINGRGDKETAFMAAGACLLSPSVATGILHGARGLTNATGAIADVRRNEVGVLYLVGLPPTGSARFLPPHGEPDLIQSVGHFAKWVYEMGAFGEAAIEREQSAHDFIQALRVAIQRSRTRPYGPTIIGIPQDVLETSWISQQFLHEDQPQPRRPSSPSLEYTVQLIRDYQRSLILLDDYLLRYPNSRSDLYEFAELTGAPVLQVRYRRGAMLFERLSRSDIPSFIGWYDPSDPKHRQLMLQADLLITLEDRNMYPRVIGQLPKCRKLAITSDAGKTRKNEYLTEDDLVLEGDVCQILRLLSSILRQDHVRSDHYQNGRGTENVEIAQGSETNSLPYFPKVSFIRKMIVDCLAQLFSSVPAPVLVDDSQMFGGMLAEEYDRFPPHLRIFGDHGGFVGAGLAFATGLAIGERDCTVVCILGDQGFSNAFQGLVAAGEQQPPIIYIVCNNGESVSLRKQMAAFDPKTLDNNRHLSLHNAANVNYLAIASALGIKSSVVEWPFDLGEQVAQKAAEQLGCQLREALDTRRPWLIELKLPPLGDVWSGIWITQGLEAQQVSTMTGQQTT